MSKIIVLGGGESGVGAALLAKSKGFDVFLSDQGTLKEVFKKHFQIITSASKKASTRLTKFSAQMK